jgi:hypothetical protein
MAVVGKSYNEISEILGVSKFFVGYWNKQFGFFLTYYAKSIAKVVKSIKQICQNVNQVLVRLDI